MKITQGLLRAKNACAEGFDCMLVEVGRQMLDGEP